MTIQNRTMEDLSEEELEAILKGLDEISDEEMAECLKIAEESLNKEPLELNVETITKAPTEDIISLLIEIRANVEKGVYTDVEREHMKSINVELTERNIPPCERNQKGFHASEIGKSETGVIKSQYAKDLQVMDLYHVWHWDNGHLTNCNSKNGLFAGIFCGESFDFQKANEIAGLEWKTMEKIGENGLNLPNCIQDKLRVLRSDAARQRQEEKNKKQIEILNRKMQVKKFMETYICNNPNHSWCIKDAIIYSDVWEAMEKSKGSIAKAMIEYQKMTGNEVSRDFIKSRRDNLSKWKSKHNWSI